MSAAATTSSATGGEVHVPIPQTGTANGDAIRESSAAPSPFRGTTPQRQLKEADPPPPAAAKAPPATAVDKTLASMANLAKLLPTGTVLAFQSLTPSFTNRGACFAANRYLTAVLLYLCVVSCIVFSFTDSFVGGDGKLYYGVATAKGFLVFNYARSDQDDGEDDDERRRRVFKDLSRFRIRWVDYVHAVLTAVVFLAVAFSDAAVESCYFPAAGENVKQMLTNLPLGAAVLSSLVFLIFPTTRKGIGYTATSSTNAQ